MSRRIASLLLLAAALPLAGCELLSGGDKGKDGESIGYACRLSDKLPEDCMKENSTYTPTSILEGWKRADKEKNPNLHPSADQTTGDAATQGEGESKPEGDQAASEEAQPATEQPEKH
ncbi:MAG: hypothetical protein KKH74_04680 [Gammaproteobacteria bacterium]|nr:hypothetical protein [Gammaproteobacteria bacterium]MBU1733293.1 hypothetical protein [Gammaproteobacteria bacterium]MBU1892341.1 hypothetical protein [Gammaproteobacteria bacterium]